VKPCEVTVFGAGYVGLVTGACLAATGHHVQMLDMDRSRLEMLRTGEVPFHEPGLADVLGGAVASGDLRFGHPDEMPTCGEFVIVAVGTPPTAGGAADLRSVRAVVDLVAGSAVAGTVVIMKSTVPPGHRGASVRGPRAGRRRIHLESRVPARGQRGR